MFIELKCCYFEGNNPILVNICRLNVLLCFTILAIMTCYKSLIKCSLLGTFQIQKRQQLVRKIHEDELIDMKDYLPQCDQKQVSVTDYKVRTTVPL